MNPPAAVRRCAAVLILAGATAVAQEPVFMDAATHPGRGQFYARLQLGLEEGTLRYDGSKGTQAGMTLKLVHGLTPRLALVLDAGLRDRVRPPEGDSEAGLADWTLRLKWRVAKLDLGPVDTWRTSLFAGVRGPGSPQTRETDRIAPTLGLASTAILGRHGFNGAMSWTAKTDAPEVGTVDVSHLFRLTPAAFTAGTRGAWYTVIESLNTVEPGGTRRHVLAPGLLYEARRWAWEAGVRLPVNDRASDRFNVEAVTGFRRLF